VPLVRVMGSWVVPTSLNANRLIGPRFRVIGPPTVHAREDILESRALRRSAKQPGDQIRSRADSPNAIPDQPSWAYLPECELGSIRLPSASES
jgi:hypothetical protein